MEYETRHVFIEQLRALEWKVLEGFDLVIEQLGRVMEAVAQGDEALALSVVTADGPIDERFLGGPPRRHRVAGKPGPRGRRSEVGGGSAPHRVVPRADGRSVVNIAKLVPLCSAGRWVMSRCRR